MQFVPAPSVPRRPAVPKGEVLEESVGERGLVPCFDRFLHAGKLGGKVGLRHVFESDRAISACISRAFTSAPSCTRRARGKPPSAAFGVLRWEALCAGPYSASFFARELVDDLGVALAAHLLHALADEEPDDLRVPVFVARHLVGVRGDDRVDDGLDTRRCPTPASCPAPPQWSQGLLSSSMTAAKTSLACLEEMASSASSPTSSTARAGKAGCRRGPRPRSRSASRRCR